jgi:hypothetical protein
LTDEGTWIVSEEEQLLAVGRVTSEYANTRKKLAALFADVDRYAGALQRVLWYIKPQDYSNTSLKDGSKPPDFGDYPSADQLRSLIDDTLATFSRKMHLQKQLKEFGVEPKD